MKSDSFAVWYCSSPRRATAAGFQASISETVSNAPCMPWAASGVGVGVGEPLGGADSLSPMLKPSHLPVETPAFVVGVGVADGPITVGVGSSGMHAVSPTTASVIGPYVGAAVTVAVVVVVVVAVTVAVVVVFAVTVAVVVTGGWAATSHLTSAACALAFCACQAARPAFAAATRAALWLTWNGVVAGRASSAISTLVLFCTIVWVWARYVDWGWQTVDASVDALATMGTITTVAAAATARVARLGRFKVSPRTGCRNWQGRRAANRGQVKFRRRTGSVWLSIAF